MTIVMGDILSYAQVLGHVLEVCRGVSSRDVQLVQVDRLETFAACTASSLGPWAGTSAGRTVHTSPPKVSIRRRGLVPVPSQQPTAVGSRHGALEPGHVTISRTVDTAIEHGQT